VNGCLIKYEVNHSQLILTIQLSTGEEVIVPVPSNVAETLGNDVFEVIYCGGWESKPRIAKVTRTIAPDGSMQGRDEDEVEYEKED
jgi:hypothetical protein